MKGSLVEYTPAVAPSGASFYLGDVIPEWQNDFFFATLRGRALYRLKIDGKKVVGQEVLFEGKFGRLRDVASGKDGYLYVISQDGQLIRIGPVAPSGAGGPPHPRAAGTLLGPFGYSADRIESHLDTSSRGGREG